MENNIQLATYFVQDIRRIVEDGRQRAYLQVSHTMIETYWNIGQRIVEEEQNGKQRAEYGSKLIDELAKILTHDFGSGFSARYLRSFRKFYLLIPDIEIWKSRFPNLLWTHIYRTLRVADATAARWEDGKKKRNIQKMSYVVCKFKYNFVPLLRICGIFTTACPKALISSSEISVWLIVFT